MLFLTHHSQLITNVAVFTGRFFDIEFLTGYDSRGNRHEMVYHLK